MPPRAVLRPAVQPYRRIGLFAAGPHSPSCQWHLEHPAWGGTRDVLISIVRGPHVTGAHGTRPLDVVGWHDFDPNMVGERLDTPVKWRPLSLVISNGLGRGMIHCSAECRCRAGSLLPPHLRWRPTLLQHHHLRLSTASGPCGYLVHVNLPALGCRTYWGTHPAGISSCAWGNLGLVANLGPSAEAWGGGDASAGWSGQGVGGWAEVG